MSSTPEAPKSPAAVEAAAIAQELRLVLHGGAWHGPALLELLADVTPAQATARAAWGAHTIWELVLHVVGWTDVVHGRLDGVAAEEPAAGDFPEPADATTASWSAALEHVREVHERLIDRVERLGEEQLASKVPGRDYDARFMLRGLIHHLVYHSGQVAVLKKQLPR